MIGASIDLSSRVFWRAPLVFSGLMAGSTIIERLLDTARLAAVPDAGWLVKGAIGIVSTLVFLLAQAAIVIVAFQIIVGSTRDVAGAMRHALRRTVTIVGSTLLTAVLVICGCILFIVPGLIAMCALFVALPAALIERLNAYDSLERSAALTRGYRWPILGIVLLSLLYTGGLDQLTGLAKPATDAWLRLQPAQLSPAVAAGLLAMLADLVISAWFFVLPAAMFHELRVVPRPPST